MAFFKSKADKARDLVISEREAAEAQYNLDQDDDASIGDLNTLGGKISNAMEKSFSLNDFQTYGREDGGGFFNVEFDLQATSGRLKGLYQREPWCYIAADRIARALSRVPMVVKDKASDEVLESHPANDVVAGGNATQDGMSLNWSGYVDMIMSGNFFKVINEDYTKPHHLPVEQVNLKIRNISTPEGMILAESRGLIEGLEVSRASTYSGHSSTSFVPYENVIHFKLANPFTPLFGMSPFTAASRAVLLDRHKNEFEMAFYLRGATNAGVIETTEDITKKRMTRLMRTFEQAFTGKRNWWRTIFLPKGAKWVKSGLTMREMEHLEGLRENRKTILACLGIGPNQVGLVDDVNRANGEVLDKIFWESTIVPLAKFIAAGYNNSYLFKEVYGDVVKVEPDFSDIMALEGSWITKGENAKAVDDVATFNEQREIAGFDPVKDSDWRANLTISEIRAAASAMAMFGDGGTMTPGEGLGPDKDPSVAQDKVNIELSQGDSDHTHAAQVDKTSLNGSTTSTNGGEAGEHQHELTGTREEGGTITVKVTEANGHTHPDIKIQEDQVLEEQKKIAFIRAKANATANQQRVAISQARVYKGVVDNTTAILLSQAKVALKNQLDVRATLQKNLDTRQRYYAENGLPILGDTMSKGFDLATRTTKGFEVECRAVSQRLAIPLFIKELKPVDEQALAVLKERNEEGQRTQLARRNINSFYGFDNTQTDNVMRIVEDGVAEGKTTESIAKTIEQDYGEKYADQAFTIARTEILTAVSAGQQWQQDELKKIFDKVNKQWFHVGDVGSNPDARSIHAGFEGLGEVSYDFIYENPTTGARMSLPRMSGTAKDDINCRCSMASVIPKDATSNAAAILA